MGVDYTGCDVPKKPVFMRVCGHHPNCQTDFATFLQHIASKKHFATDEVVATGLEVN